MTSKGFSKVTEEKREEWETVHDLPELLFNESLDPGLRTAYLIHPVRKATKETDILTRQYVVYLEDNNYRVFIPAKHNPFEGRDRTGRNICLVNRAATLLCDEVHAIWSSDSSGSLFDLGMAFAFLKPLTIVDALDYGEGASFESMIGDWPWGLWIAERIDAVPWFRTRILQYPTLKIAEVGNRLRPVRKSCC